MKKFSYGGKILLVAIFIVMIFGGVFWLASVGTHNFSDCVFVGLFGECAPTDDILALTNHHSAIYKILSRTSSGWNFILAIGMIFLAYGLIKKKVDVGFLRYPTSVLDLRFSTNPFNWLSPFRSWLVLKRADGLL